MKSCWVAAHSSCCLRPRWILLLTWYLGTFGTGVAVGRLFGCLGWDGYRFGYVMKYWYLSGKGFFLNMHHLEMNKCYYKIYMVINLYSEVFVMFFSGVDIANLGNRLEENGLDLGKLAPLYWILELTTESCQLSRNNPVILLISEIRLTTWDVWYPVNNRSYYLQGIIHPRWLAGFLNHQQ